MRSRKVAQHQDRGDRSGVLAERREGQHQDALAAVAPGGAVEGLAGRSFGGLGQPATKADADRPATDLPPIYSDLFALTQGQEAMRVAGSLFGSMQQAMPIAGAIAPSPWVF